MAKKRSVKDAAIEILGKQEKPMPINDLAEQIMATPGVKLEGKTPKATIRKTLDRSNDFVRTAPGMYRLDALAKGELERKENGETDEAPAGDEFAVDLKDAARAADQKTKSGKRRAAKSDDVKPDPKPGGGKKRQKVNA